MLQSEIRIGIYRHNKSGNLYLAKDVGRETETGRWYVVYKRWRNADGSMPELKDLTTHLRPASMWEQTVNIAGKQVPRFEWIGSEPHTVLPASQVKDFELPELNRLSLLAVINSPFYNKVEKQLAKALLERL